MIVCRKRVMSMLLFFLVSHLVIGCLAIDPYWTYSTTGGDIGDIAIAPDGSSVIAGAGKVLVFSGNGSLLSQHPFGNMIVQTRDGRYLVTAYFSSVYMFERIISKSDRHVILNKIWENSVPTQVTSLVISDKGDRVAVAAEGEGLYIFNQNGTSGGSNDEYNAILGMGANGNRIVGISAGQGLKTYNKTGRLLKTYDIPLTNSPKSFLVTPLSGVRGVYNSAQKITSVSLLNGTTYWSVRASGDVNMLAATPGGDFIVAGTENGNVDLYRNNGNLSWIYQSTDGKLNNQGIKAVAISPGGNYIAAGSFDGRIILLNSDGTLLWSYNSKKQIRKIAFSGDGSLVVAAGSDTIYAFLTGDDQRRTTTIPIPKNTSLTSPRQAVQGTTKSGVTIPITTQEAPPATPTVQLTEYEVIRTATKSPLEFMTGILAVGLGFLLMKRT